jgi:hypothetical protein
MKASPHSVSGANDRWRWVSLGVVSLGLVVQVIFLFRAVLAPQVREVWQVRNLPAWERSARLAFGDDFSEYVSFLRSRVPEEATLVIPRQDADYVFGHVGMMQYFMQPRTIINCAQGAIVEECIRNLGGKDIYILAVGHYPPQEEALLRRDYVAFDERRGVYIPRD